MSDNHVFQEESVESHLKNEFQELGFELDTWRTWLKNPPVKTTFRVNTVNYTLEEANAIIQASLKDVAASRGITSIPNVSISPGISDVLIIEPWPELAIEIFGSENHPHIRLHFVLDIDDLQIPNGENQRVIVDCACGAAVLRGANIFAPGILAMSKGTHIGDTVDIFVDLDAKCLKGAVNYQGKTQFVGYGKVCLDRINLFCDKISCGVAVKVLGTPSGCVPLPLPPELGVLQNLPSSVAAWELAPMPGEAVLDMCAAPGNKTTHLATLMQNQGTLIALDRTTKKISQIMENCDRLFCKCLAFACDSTKSVLPEPDPSRDIKLGPPFNPESFHKVLLDAPCSALGQRPQFINKISLSQLKSYSPLQRRLFDAAVRLTKPGGEIVYSTCTISYAENEGLVQWALQKYGNLLTLQAPRLRMSEVSTPRVKSSVSEDVHNCVQRFGPPASNKESLCDSVGFFIARFKKSL